MGITFIGNDCTFEQDGAKAHFHEQTEEWCDNNSITGIISLQIVLI